MCVSFFSLFLVHHTILHHTSHHTHTTLHPHTHRTHHTHHTHTHQIQIPHSLFYFYLSFTTSRIKSIVRSTGVCYKPTHQKSVNGLRREESHSWVHSGLEIIIAKYRWEKKIFGFLDFIFGSVYSVLFCFVLFYSLLRNTGEKNYLFYFIHYCEVQVKNIVCFKY